MHDSSVNELRSQKLLIPKSLEMTRQLELTVIENMKIFDDFGFKIEVNEEAPPTKKLKLIMIPYTAKATFGSDDVNDFYKEVCGFLQVYMRSQS